MSDTFITRDEQHALVVPRPVLKPPPWANDPATTRRNTTSKSTRRVK